LTSSWQNRILANTFYNELTQIDKPTRLPSMFSFFVRYEAYKMKCGFSVLIEKSQASSQCSARLENRQFPGLLFKTFFSDNGVTQSITKMHILLNP
jgi:hypothetical protein